MTQEAAEKFYRELLGKIDKLLPAHVRTQIREYMGARYEKRIGAMLLIARYLTLAHSETVELAQGEKDEALYATVMATIDAILQEMPKHMVEKPPDYIG